MTTLQVRVQSSDKEAASKVLNEIGMDIPTAIRVYLKKIASTGSIPFSLQIGSDENGFTTEQVEEILKASKEADQGINLSSEFDSVEEAIAYLNEK